MQINIISAETVDTPRSNSAADANNLNQELQAKINPSQAIESLEGINTNENMNLNIAQQPEEITSPTNDICQLETIPFQRARTKKRTSKFISHSFIREEPDQLQTTSELTEQQLVEDIQTQPQLPECPRYKSCLKSRGKFKRSTRKKRSRSFFNTPLKPIIFDNSDDNANYEPLKSSFKVNFNQRVRVERVESYKAYNVLEDELKQKIVRNSRFAKEESQQKRSQQPSIASAFGGQVDNNKLCCFIF